MGFGLKCVYNFYLCSCICTCVYVVVYQVGEGAPIPFWLLVFSIKTLNDNEIKNFTMKYDKKNIKGIKINHFDARLFRFCISMKLIRLKLYDQIIW